MEAHLRVHNSMQSAIAFEQSFDDNYSDKNSNKTINESIIFVPQMELEVIEFANHSANTGIEHQYCHFISYLYSFKIIDPYSNQRSDSK